MHGDMQPWPSVCSWSQGGEAGQGVGRALAPYLPTLLPVPPDNPPQPSSTKTDVLRGKEAGGRSLAASQFQTRRSAG